MNKQQNPRLSNLVRTSALALAGTLAFLAPRAASALYAPNLDIQGLYAQTQNLAAGATVTWETTNCSSAEDTVMLAVSGFSGATGIRKTLAINDNKTSSDTCSKITFTNTTSASYQYTLVIANKETGLATVNLLKDGSTQTTNLAVGGEIALRTYGVVGAKIFRTVPVRSDQSGGGPNNPQMFVISPTVGGSGSWDHDSGLGQHALINQSTLTSTQYWIVIGGSANLSTRVSLWVQGTALADADGDGISDSDEAFIGTNSTKADTDGDGLSDFAEFMGIPAASLSGADSSLILPWQGGTGDPNPGSNPTVKDVFVEVDYMFKTGVGAHSHDPAASGNWTTYQTDLDTIYRANSSATGQTVRFHAERSNSINEVDSGGVALNPLTFETAANCPNSKRFQDFKTSATYFDPMRLSAYHYVIMGHNYRWVAPGTANCVTTTSSGLAETFGNDVMVTLGPFGGQVGTINEQKGSLIHEIGHNFGLSHNNNDAEGQSCVHASVMNYRYTFSGTGLSPINPFSYSTGQFSRQSACGLTAFATVGGQRCVRVGDASLKKKAASSIDCTPTVGAAETNCDCDPSEWANLTLIGTGGSWASGDSQGNTAEQKETERARFLSEFALGRSGRYEPSHRKELKARRDELVLRGLSEGVDFRVEPESQRIYMP